MEQRAIEDVQNYFLRTHLVRKEFLDRVNNTIQSMPLSELPENLLEAPEERRLFERAKRSARDAVEFYVLACFGIKVDVQTAEVPLADMVSHSNRAAIARAAAAILLEEAAGGAAAALPAAGGAAAALPEEGAGGGAGGGGGAGALCEAAPLSVDASVRAFIRASCEKHVRGGSRGMLLTCRAVLADTQRRFSLSVDDRSAAALVVQSAISAVADFSPPLYREWLRLSQSLTAGEF
jgi:hypothetical protein